MIKLDIPTFEKEATRKILYGESITLGILVEDAKKHFKELIDIKQEKQKVTLFFTYPFFEILWQTNNNKLFA